jgi:hypothetical protein
MVFVEASLFTKLLPHYLSDDEYRGLQIHLLQRPDAGALIRGSGGARKGEQENLSAADLKRIAKLIEELK